MGEDELFLRYRVCVRVVGVRINGLHKDVSV